jgi:hypothetical protein
MLLYRHLLNNFKLVGVEVFTAVVMKSINFKHVTVLLVTLFA